MNKLVGGESFLVPTFVPMNSRSIRCETLVDTGASGYIFVNVNHAIRLAKSHISHVINCLPHPVQPRAFDGSLTPSITHMLVAAVQIDGRRFHGLPMVITNLGNYDMIIGRNWLAEHDIWLDVKNKKLLWPDSRLRAHSTSKRNSSTASANYPDIAMISPLTE